MQRRRQLELDVINAIVALAENMDCDAFALPAPNSEPRFIVCWGEASAIVSMLGEPRPTVVVDSAGAPVANDPHP